MHIRQAEVAALEFEGEASVVDAEEVEDGGVEVGPGDTIFDGFPADFVGGAKGYARF